MSKSNKNLWKRIEVITEEGTIKYELDVKERNKTKFRSPKVKKMFKRTYKEYKNKINKEDAEKSQTKDKVCSLAITKKEIFSYYNNEIINKQPDQNKEDINDNQTSPDTTIFEGVFYDLNEFNIFNTNDEYCILNLLNEFGF